MQVNPVGYIKGYVARHFPKLEFCNSNVFGHDGVVTYRATVRNQVLEILFSMPKTAPADAIPLLQKVSEIHRGRAQRVWEFQRDCLPYVPLSHKWRVHLWQGPTGELCQVQVDETDDVVETVVRLNGDPFAEPVLTKILVWKVSGLWGLKSRLTRADIQMIERLRADEKKKK